MCLLSSIYYSFNSNGSLRATSPEHCALSSYCSSDFPQQDLLSISPRTIHVVLHITVDYVLSPFALAQDHATPMPSSSHIREPKIVTLLPLSGKRDNTKSFINGCCLYMNSQKPEFPDKDAKIYWILLYMQTGSAKTWRNYIVTLMYKGQQLFSTSDELLKEIDWRFSDTDKRTTQLLKIRTIQQGDRSVDEHVQEFEKAALEAGYEGYPLVVEFKCLLNSGLRRRLTELWPMPVTIQQWYDEAIMMDCQWKVAVRATT